MPEKVSHKNHAEKQSEKERTKYLKRASKEVYRAEAELVDRGMFHKYFGYKFLVQCQQN